MQNETIIFRLEQPEDYRTVENLTREAFWNVYQPGCMEHYVLHCYREDPDFIPELDFVLETDGKIIGHIMYVHSEIVQEDGTHIPIITFGPVSILPEHQRQGYGKSLIDYSLAQAEKMGFGAVAITGNIEVYGKSGFVTGKSRNIYYGEDPDSEYFLIKELKPGFLDEVTGTFRDPDGYFICQNDPEGFEAFENTFPTKEKKKLPGQLF